MTKMKSRPCRHPDTARRAMKDDPPTFTCVKCGAQVSSDKVVEGQLRLARETGYEMR